MHNLIFFSSQPVLTISQAGVWIPSYSLLYFILIVGAFLTAGVALAAFSFYEDFYWGDSKFREQLRFHPSHRASEEVKPTKT